MNNLPEELYQSIFCYFNLNELINLRIVSKRMKFLIDQYKIDELVLNLKYFNFRKLNSNWYKSEITVKNQLNLNHSLDLRHKLIRNELNTLKFSNLKRLKLIFLSRYSNKNSKGHYLFKFILDNLDNLFKYLDQFELEIVNEIINDYRLIEHSNLKILFINYIREQIEFTINCPKLKVFYFGGQFKGIKINNSLSIEHLELDYNIQLQNEINLSEFGNLKYFYYSGNPINLNATKLFVELNKLTHFNYNQKIDQIDEKFNGLQSFKNLMLAILRERNLMKINCQLIVDNIEIDNEKDLLNLIDNYDLNSNN